MLSGPKISYLENEDTNKEVIGAARSKHGIARIIRTSKLTYGHLLVGCNLKSLN